MDISALLKDPKALYDNLQTFMNSQERVEDGLGDLSFANGVMTAVALSPELIRPSEWTPVVTGPLDQFENPADAQLFLSFMGLQYNLLLNALDNDKKPYEPLFWKDGEGRVITKDWGDGFLSGVGLRADAWQARMASDQDVSLLVAMAYILEGSDATLAKVAETGANLDILTREANTMAAEVIRQIYRRSGKKRGLAASLPGSAEEGAKQKAGRNDPCPCGSGKKYKKCCLS